MKRPLRRRIGRDTLPDAINPLASADVRQCQVWLALGPPSDRWLVGPEADVLGNSRGGGIECRPEQSERHGLEILLDTGAMERVADAAKAAQPHAFEATMRLQVRGAASRLVFLIA
jgi:hypothetical protein